MTAEILTRERAGAGWYRYLGVVQGVKVGVRLPMQYVESVSAKEAESEVKEALCNEYERLHVGDGGAYAR